MNQSLDEMVAALRANGEFILAVRPVRVFECICPHDCHGCARRFIPATAFQKTEEDVHQAMALPPLKRICSACPGGRMQ